MAGVEAIQVGFWSPTYVTAVQCVNYTVCDLPTETGDPKKQPTELFCEMRISSGARCGDR